MRLSKLSISGFKSFAKNTVLEFPVEISAIVGPNGSGKSNIAEAIRWVLGEQSMKSLRGRRGEDLIFNGSPKVPRMGKASVALYFENHDGKIPLDFPEVIVERKIFRDGSNEYSLNNSIVRLKDIVGLIARMGLGDQKHNIIGQGEVDRWLLSSSRDRKEILEEALGLKVYQIKKIESERKFALTQENMNQVEALVREIAPHLKFLKHQAEKAEARETLEADLEKLERIYFCRILVEIEREEKEIAKDAAPFEKELASAEAKVRHLKSTIEAREAEALNPDDVTSLENSLAALETTRQNLEREFGRAEGRALAEKDRLAKPSVRIADPAYIKEKITKLLSLLKESLGNPAELAHKIESAVFELESLISDIDRGSVELTPDAAWQKDLKILEEEAKRLEAELQKAAADLSKKREAVRVRESVSRATEADLRKLERELREAEELRGKIRSKLERTNYLRENIHSRRETLKKELALVNLPEAKVREVDANDLAHYPDAQDLFKKIERLRGKLEEIGGIDASVVKEYTDTESRYQFLTKELEDLKAASASLQELIETLEKQIADDFDRGFKKINEGFDQYFKIIFGGGHAKLTYEKLGRRKSDEDEKDGLEEPEEIEYGIDIDVDIPRKRIRSLSMLSGGERALASIALLFAMVLVNPPPFLVLDETDAALDEANSQKYADTLVELSKKTQLIIITHNRETMLRAGILYGVTMGDDGISKLVSIKFEEGEQYVSR
ncbi:MAG: AAA family ATPase [Candidatus Sungbacteria bacterium]|uniref:AAA family ATPase n=1 Tax=Candidatus Sungiibacteriota bacterium TaxID=2750080 RepID=A0A9D6LUL4_9BACT|nr:AAA family ATPase [Candidatus Sungbacteria bacterium]